MTTVGHARRIGLLMLAAAALLGWLIAHTDVFFADGLRYIAQARTIEKGAWAQGLIRSVDHPIYPLAIAAVHRLLGGEDPRSWQTAAQIGAATAGTLLVIPVYLISAELFGGATAWLACFLIYLLPFNGHVLADTLSESTFLLFWSWGVWSAIKFLGSGRLGWVPLLIVLSVLAYLARPEGLILPVALLIALVMLSLARAPGIPAVKRRWAIVVLVAGPIAAAGPFMVMKGGISTKPSIKRILGLEQPAPAMAVERERPLDSEQSTTKTIMLATRAMIRAVEGATSLPLLLLAPLGIAATWSSATARRIWLYLGTILGLSVLAMIRLHMMSGYCTPRHAMVVAWILVPASAAGLNRLAAAASRWVARLASPLASAARIEIAGRCVIVGAFLAWWGPAAIAAIDPGFGGYRQAGLWLASTALPGEPLIDPKGFSIFYAGKPGYTFATLGEGIRDPRVRWVVAHEALIFGPWDYGKALRAKVAGRRPVRIFPAKPVRGVCKVYVYDLARTGNETARTSSPQSAARR